jgi:uridine kinase
VDPRGPLTYAALAARVRGAEPRLGGTRLVCIDGPAGSGKTTFAARLADEFGEDAVVVHLEDLYAGWTLTGAVARLSAAVLLPVSAGRQGSYRPYDWHAGAFARDAVPVPPLPVLVVEGCGSSPRALDPWTTVRIWVEAPPTLRTERGLARDGVATEPDWRRWQSTEAAEFAREDTRARADLRVDGARTSSDGSLARLPERAAQPRDV